MGKVISNISSGLGLSEGSTERAIREANERRLEQQKAEAAKAREAAREAADDPGPGRIGTFGFRPPARQRAPLKLRKAPAQSGGLRSLFGGAVASQREAGDGR